MRLLLCPVYTLTNILGSIAAGIQGVIGNVAARSLFAILQSAGAGGYGVAAIHGIVRVIGAVVGVGGIGDFFRGQGDGDDDSENEDGNGGNHGEGNNDKEEEAEKEKGEGDEQTDKLASIP